MVKFLLASGKLEFPASLDKKTFWCLTLRLIYIWGIMIDRSGQFVLIIYSLFAVMGLQNMGYVQAILWDVLMGLRVYLSQHTHRLLIGVHFRLILEWTRCVEGDGNLKNTLKFNACSGFYFPKWALQFCGWLVLQASSAIRKKKKKKRAYNQIQTPFQLLSQFNNVVLSISFN